MLKSLWSKFLLLLIAVVAIGLSATFLLRELMVKDFREYLEGEREDRAYWVTAALESSYDKYNGWREERFGMTFMDKGITLELTCDEDAAVSADPDKLSQIIINLLSNAIKATERGGRVWIKAVREKSEVRIEIGDTGCGIRDSDLPFIFERFYRISKGGLGIGLTIVKELAEAHGGKINVESSYGKGSVFTLILPV